MSADAVPVIITNPVSPLESLFNVPIAAMQSVRQGFNFRWANAAARTAQTGMRTNDVAYQIDTDTVYRYNSGWSVWTQPRTTFTPTFTGLALGNGTATCRYAVSEGVVYADYNITLGSSSAVSGAIGVSAPIGSFSVVPNATILLIDASLGAAGRFVAHPLVSSGSMILYVDGTAGAYNTITATSATVPTTWTTSDQISIAVTYML